MKIKKIVAGILAGAMLCGLCACGGAKETGAGGEAANIKIAFQYGLAYAPLTIMQEQGLIEKYYDGEVTAEWVNLNSGSAINEGVASGDIDVAAMGVAPFLTGVTKGIPYKMFATMSAQPHKLMTNQPGIQTLADITAENKIALVNIGSIQHILLGMLAEKELGDAHALDNNIVAMSHPDGMSALLAGSADCQLTTAPYIYQELAAGGITEVEGLSEVWPDGNAFIIALVSDELCEKNPALYEAVVAAMDEAIKYLNENQEEAAVILAEKQDVETEEMLSWMQDPACVFDTKLPGIMDMAAFMEKAGFLEKAPESFEAITTESAR